MGRRKNRWVLAKVNLQDQTQEAAASARIFTREAFDTEITRICDVLFGSIGGGYVADATNVVLVNETESLVLLQTKRCFLPKVICVLRCLERVQKVPVTVDVLHIGGTLHQCKKLLFSKLLRTLSQLQALTLGQSAPKPAFTHKTLEAIKEVEKLRNPTT
ncbi:Ribonuclease P/MRP protein subunit [Babesia bigemina]|uniref:Ribonuclease P/MRP protein subunit n=1 Tax=Babesia bigemina TaxID=5866 RepID=A0A061DAN2_BABBI|nr:Ribonuclease P/MRP protein subunit [Babesia bigemina]CDR95964.1 Ribonuclease P/MRP protein subunit [Babesia bigemina]|eukprot:XP_012768150.1 Ribonuclease P/MRP protein subunit [Babesia bigemina]